MTVVFADVANRTALHRKLGAAAAQQVIGSALHAVRDMVSDHEGRVAKPLGDAVTCVFPEAEAALQAACAMQTVTRSRRFDDESVQLQIGAHYGTVLTEGEDVFGDTVNAAAYLAASATGEQILATEAVLNRLTPEARGCARPMFHAALKGSSAQCLVYQVLWRAEDLDVTTVNLHAGKLIPRDTGSLMVCCGDTRLRIDQLHPTITLGRSADCDIVVADMFASRQHATIKLRRMRFYLLDHSTNGTFVSMLGEEVHVLRGELLLAEAGEISLGRRASATEPAALRFERDRRSLYRA